MTFTTLCVQDTISSCQFCNIAILGLLVGCIPEVDVTTCFLIPLFPYNLLNPSAPLLPPLHSDFPLHHFLSSPFHFIMSYIPMVLLFKRKIPSDPRKLHTWISRCSWWLLTGLYLIFILSHTYMLNWSNCLSQMPAIFISDDVSIFSSLLVFRSFGSCFTHVVSV